MSTARRPRKSDDAEDDSLAKQREERKREREDRKKQRDSEGNQADADRQKQREERRKQRQSGEDSGKAPRQEDENKKREEEARRKREEEEQRRQLQQQQQQQQQQQEEEEEEEEAAPPPAKSADKTDGPKSAFDKIDDDRKRRIIDSLIDRLYELAEEKEAKNKPATKTTSTGGTSPDMSQLDLKVRSLRTRLRNAENATSTLAKQQKDVEQKIKMNHQEVERLRKEYASAEAEYNKAVESGAIPAEAPKRGRGAAGKGSGFFDVVKKAQSSLWEDKFRAFKEKQRETSSNQPEWVNNLKKSDSHIMGTTVMKREDPEKKKEKAAWQNQPKVHKAVIDPRAKKEVEPAGAKKPAWSGVSLKKAEKK